MGFEAREAILDVLDQAIADTGAQVRVVAYDLNQPDIVTRLEKLGPRVKVIIDDSADHGAKGSAENEAEQRLIKLKIEVRRQHLASLQHNKFIAVNGPKAQLAVCGSTNFSWRAFYVQNNNALVLQGKDAVKPFLEAFDNYWNNSTGKPAADVAGFAATTSVKWAGLGLTGIDAMIAFSPHSASNALLKTIADDVQTSTTSSLFIHWHFSTRPRELLRTRSSKLRRTKGSLFMVFPTEKSKVLPMALSSRNPMAISPRFFRCTFKESSGTF